MWKPFDNKELNLTFMAWFIIVLYMLIAEETILFAIVVKPSFDLNR